jgi:hypothetical protein
MGIGFHWINQTNKEIYKEQVHFSNHILCYEMGGDKSNSNKYYSFDQCWVGITFLWYLSDLVFIKQFIKGPVITFFP